MLETLRLLILKNSLNTNSNLSETIRPAQSVFRHSSRTFFAVFVIGLLYFVFLPSFPTTARQKMFSKRPDKHTTGLINMRNDCFANSSLQAYSSLPGLTEYLNKFIQAYNLMLEASTSFDVDLDQIISSESLSVCAQSKFNNKETEQARLVKNNIKIFLHIALAKILKNLQETQLTSRTISVWTFLHEIERIYNAKISRSQHDAHELTQLINETLETENLNCIKVLKAFKEHCLGIGEISKCLDTIEFPEFPFNGLILSQMKCLECSFVSKPSITPFLMLTLHLPQEPSTSLEELLEKNGSETISGYQCLKCRITKILKNEAHFAKQGRSNDHEFQISIDKLMELADNQHLFINEDLLHDLENFIKNYDQDGIKISCVTSKVFRKTQILKPPKVFGIHLSRSAFNGVSITRNPCRVSFNDKLTLSIDEEYLPELHKFRQGAADDTFNARFTSKVLTTDANDMEDESVQREDFDLTGEETETESDDKDSTSNDWPSSDTELVDTESESLSSVSTAQPPVSMGDKDSASISDTLQVAPISKDQEMSLLNHFRQFKFSETNNYKYRLRAVIRHQGSHTQGHYECYKRKPLFVKDNDGNIIKLSSEIDESNLKEAEQFLHSENIMGKNRTSSASSYDLEESGDLVERGNFRRKISSMMGRRPSIIQADPNEANLQEIIASGLTTPAEVLVDDYFNIPTAEDVNNQLNKKIAASDGSSKVKLKKIPSMLKHPYWRVGDSQITEVSRSAVMLETSSVYMLYYERSDRIQGK